MLSLIAAFSLFCYRVRSSAGRLKGYQAYIPLAPVKSANLFNYQVFTPSPQPLFHGSRYVSGTAMLRFPSL